MCLNDISFCFSTGWQWCLGATDCLDQDGDLWIATWMTAEGIRSTDRLSRIPDAFSHFFTLLFSIHKKELPFSTQVQSIQTNSKQFSGSEFSANHDDTGRIHRVWRHRKSGKSQQTTTIDYTDLPETLFPFLKFQHRKPIIPNYTNFLHALCLHLCEIIFPTRGTIEGKSPFCDWGAHLAVSSPVPCGQKWGKRNVLCCISISRIFFCPFPNASRKIGSRQVASLWAAVQKRYFCPQLHCLKWKRFSLVALFWQETLIYNAWGNVYAISVVDQLFTEKSTSLLRMACPIEWQADWQKWLHFTMEKVIPVHVELQRFVKQILNLMSTKTTPAKHIQVIVSFPAVYTVITWGLFRVPPHTKLQIQQNSSGEAGLAQLETHVAG